MPNNKHPHLKSGLFTLLILAIILPTVWYGLVVNIVAWPVHEERDDLLQQDIYYAWVEGARILSGENPYSRILPGDMRTNDKYATYFPLFYLASAATQKMGLTQYPDWLHFWRVIFGICYFLIGGLLFEACRRSSNLPLALFAVLFWLLNRWSVVVIQIGHLDFLALVPLLLSLLLFGRHRNWSYILLGLSFAIKQIGIFVAPLYLIWAWRERNTRQGIQETLTAIALIALVPLLSSLPFLVWEPIGFLKSIAFSVTRSPTTHYMPASIDTFLQYQGLIARIPLILLLSFAYWAAVAGKAGRYGSVLLVFSAFLDFNPVLFYQYFIWALPFVVLAVNEWHVRRTSKAESDAPGNGDLSA